MNSTEMSFWRNHFGVKENQIFWSNRGSRYSFWMLSIRRTWPNRLVLDLLVATTLMTRAINRIHIQIFTYSLSVGDSRTSFCRFDVNCDNVSFQCWSNQSSIRSDLLSWLIAYIIHFTVCNSYYSPENSSAKQINDSIKWFRFVINHQFVFACRLSETHSISLAKIEI